MFGGVGIFRSSREAVEIQFTAQSLSSLPNPHVNADVLTF
jgi:hypothetical protein